MTISRRGNTLVIVLGLALLLAVQITIVNSLSMGGFRHLNRVNAHVRAIAVGESAFARILARIKGAPWEQRWFAAAPRAEASVPLLGGSYASYINTVASPEKQADVWIQARYEGSVAVMFWRVRYVDDTLDFTAQVFPTFFTFLPPDAPSPQDGPNPTTSTLIDQMDHQRQNRDPVRRVIEELRHKPRFEDVAKRLNIPLKGRPVDDREPPGLPPFPQDGYINDIDRDLTALPSPPADPPPPPTPTPQPPPVSPPPPSLPPPAGSIAGITPDTPLGKQYPTPTNIVDVTRAILGAVTATPPIDPDLPTSTWFTDPATAKSEWQTAEAQFIVTWENPAIEQSLIHTTNFIAQLTGKGTPEGKQAADNLLAYFADITQAQVKRKVPPPAPPDPAAVDPGAKDAAGYSRALSAYTQWWLANH